MGFPRLSLFIFMPLLFFLSQLHLSSPFIQPLCHRDERSALLQFKESFIIDESVSFDDDCQKVASWKVEGDESDCCSWDGVECNEGTGHVIGLDLNNSCLKGSINSSSSLFRLVHLQSLNLAFNDFSYSQIPSQVRDLSRLTVLNLSSSYFTGQIPLEISQLSHLSSLDLSDYHHTVFDAFPSLELINPGLRSIVGNLTRLEKLDLSWVNIGSTVPNILANLSSLTVLSLGFCGLYGEFPMGIFKLSNLRVLSVPYNEGLTGYLPGFKWSGPLEALNLQETNFSGELDISGCNFSGNIGFLTELDILGCNFSGSIPSSLGKLTNLTSLDLSMNAFVGNIPPSLGNLTKLVDLRLASNSFVGNIPPSLANLVQLSSLDISYNQLTGSVPFELVNLPQLNFVLLSHNLLSGEMHFGLMNQTQLKSLDLRNNQLTGPITFGPMNLTRLHSLYLSANNLHGQISNSIFNLKNLESLDLSENYLIVEFDKVARLKYLTALDLSGNQLLLPTKETNANATVQKFEFLEFSSCNLSEFPNFLRNQDKLWYLNLSNNKIHTVPEWMWNTSTPSLTVLDLSNNSLTSFGQHPNFLPLTRLVQLDLKFNLLQGSLPIPPVSTIHFSISNNFLTGNIPKLFCNRSSLQTLDLANNSLSGSLPRCLGNFGASLSILNLGMNKFQGSIPETWVNGSQLEIIIFSLNKFQGHLPRLLAKCTMLKVLDLSNNQFNDRFPSWLENLPNLEVLILRSNNFNGQIKTSKSEYMFPNLQIIDLSNNSFIGKLPLNLFSNSKAKTFETANYPTYLQVMPTPIALRNIYEYYYSMTMTNKGKVTLYEKVPASFRAIDFSNNRFVGEISDFIENLRGFHLLNLSNNCLTGHIPSFLENLTELEALDLSQNKLSGEIPQQLIQLTFLAVLNVSYNNLTGPIPQGKQFDTFENNSFEGNPGLCGTPLTRKCGNSNWLASQPLIFEESQDSGSLFEFGWKIVVIGYGFGFVVGVIIGQIVVARKHDWLMKTLRIRPVNGRRCRN